MDVARQDYGIGGRPTNNARVAMLTGLSRHEVARIHKILDGSAADAPPPTAKSRITEILTGWHTDADFLDAGGEPRELPVGDAGFAALLKRYAGDLPHVALTKEMLQLGVMEKTADGYRALMRDYVHTSLSPDLITYMGDTLHDHAATLAFNLDAQRENPALFEGRASNLHVSPRAVKKFLALVEEHGLEFLEEMDSWLARHEVDPAKDSDTRQTRLGVGVYVFLDDEKSGKTR